METGTGIVLRSAVPQRLDSEQVVLQEPREPVTTQQPVQPQTVPSPQGLLHPHGLLHHRVREVAWHIPWYGFKTQARLAADSGVSPSTISRLLRGRELPSLLVTLRLTEALSKRLGRPIEVRELFSLDGLYARSVCDLASCRGCQTPTAFDRSDNMVADAPSMETGQWVLPVSRKGER